MSKIVYYGHVFEDQPRITFNVDNKRYEYILPNKSALESITYLIRKVSIGKAFAQTKRIGKLYSLKVPA